VIEVTLANLTPQRDFSPHSSIHSLHEIEVIGSGITTIAPGVIRRLVASDQVRVDVLVHVAQVGGNATIRIKDSLGNILGDAVGWPISPLQEYWVPDAEVLSRHETPTWVRSSLILSLVSLGLTRAFISGIKPSSEFCELLVLGL
jgi:alpha-L-fucosidase